MSKRKLEVCLSPALYEQFRSAEVITVVVDILRATSAICAALENGALSLIPVATVERAREYKERGYLVAAERDGFVLDFADFGNSPFNFTRERVEGKDIAYSTTNGTRTIEMASVSHQVVIGAFTNITALEKWLLRSQRDVVILCAGWKNRVNLEDSFFAGALADRLIASGLYETGCDSAMIALDLWQAGKEDIIGYIEKAAQRQRLREKGLDDCIPYCHTADSTKVIPGLWDGRLINMADLDEKPGIK